MNLYSTRYLEAATLGRLLAIWKSDLHSFELSVHNNSDAFFLSDHEKFESLNLSCGDGECHATDINELMSRLQKLNELIIHIHKQLGFGPQNVRDFIKQREISNKNLECLNIVGNFSIEDEDFESLQLEYPGMISGGFLYDRWHLCIV